MGNSIFRLPLSAAQPPFRLPHAPLSHSRRNRPDSPHLPTRAGLRRHPYPRAPLPSAAKRLHRHVAQRTQLLPPPAIPHRFCPRHMARAPPVYPRMQPHLATPPRLPRPPLRRLPCAARRLHRPPRLPLPTPARRPARFGAVQHGAAGANHRRFFHAKAAIPTRRCRAQTRVATLFAQPRRCGFVAAQDEAVILLTVLPIKKPNA